MANSEHLALLKKGVEAWNRWRKENPYIRPDLGGADLSRAILSEVNLRGADLRRANLREGNFSAANINQADLRWANLKRADLSRAKLSAVDLRRTDLSAASLGGADLRDTDLSVADLSDTDLSDAMIGSSTFAGNNLSTTKGLDSVQHWSPSSIGVDTIFMSKGKIPLVFLRGAGVPEILIEYLPSLLGTGIECYSLFISYSTADEEFASRLHNDLQARGIRCWFAPHDIEGGKKIHEQVERAIHMQERTLVILSESSIQKPWVQYEMKNARTRELEENRPVLFPISICNYETLKNWTLFHVNADLAEEIREYYIPDFREWHNPAKYKFELEKLVKSLNKKVDPS